MKKPLLATRYIEMHIRFKKLLLATSICIMTKITATEEVTEF